MTDEKRILSPPSEEGLSMYCLAGWGETNGNSYEENKKSL
jgi:hypothetical protein